MRLNKSEFVLNYVDELKSLEDISVKSISKKFTSFIHLQILKSSQFWSELIITVALAFYEMCQNLWVFMGH